MHYQALNMLKEVKFRIKVHIGCVYTREYMIMPLSSVININTPIIPRPVAFFNSMDQAVSVWTPPGPPS